MMLVDVTQLNKAQPYILRKTSDAPDSSVCAIVYGKSWTMAHGGGMSTYALTGELSWVFDAYIFPPGLFRPIGTWHFSARLWSYKKALEL